MNIPREMTNSIRYILDNWIPPVIRDSYIFMYPIARLVFGKHASLFLQFRQKVHTYSTVEYQHIYETVNPLFSRETDLTRSCIYTIEQRILGNSVLEVGCGRGFLSKRLAHKFTVTAMDIDVDSTLRTIPHLTTTRGYIEKIPMKNRSVDTVVSTHTLEHIVDIQQAISELRRVAKKRIIIVVPMQRPYTYTLDLHVQFFPYPSSFLTVMQPKKNRHYTCTIIDGDLYYEEDV